MYFERFTRVHQTNSVRIVDIHIVSVVLVVVACIFKIFLLFLFLSKISHYWYRYTMCSKMYGYSTYLHILPFLHNCCILLLAVDFFRFLLLISTWPCASKDMGIETYVSFLHSNSHVLEMLLKNLALLFPLQWFIT